MDYTKLEGSDKARKKIHKMRVRMVAVRMVLVLDTTDTIAARRYTEGCKSSRVCPDNAAFSGSARMMPYPHAYDAPGQIAPCA